MLLQSRISPEAPVHYCCRRERSVAGGAANVSLNLSSLGASVETIGWFAKMRAVKNFFKSLVTKILSGLKFQFSSCQQSARLEQLPPINKFVGWIEAHQ